MGHDLTLIYWSWRVVEGFESEEDEKKCSDNDAEDMVLIVVHAFDVASIECGVF